MVGCRPGRWTFWAGTLLLVKEVERVCVEEEEEEGDLAWGIARKGEEEGEDGEERLDLRLGAEEEEDMRGEWSGGEGESLGGAKFWSITAHFFVVCACL